MPVCRKVVAEYAGRSYGRIRGDALLAPQHYATEVKQYAADVLVTVLMISTTKMCHDRHGDTKSLTCWSVAAILGSLISFVGIFAFLSSYLVLIGDSLITRNSRNATRVFLASLLVLMAMGIHYGFYIRFISQSPALSSYWQDYFPMWGSNLLRDQALLLYQVVRSAWSNHPALHPWVVIATSVIGWVAWLRRDRPGALCALLTLLLTVVACLFHKWPMGERGTRVNLHTVAIVNISSFMLAPAAIWAVGQFRARFRWARLVPATQRILVSQICLGGLAALAGCVLLGDCFRPDHVEPRAIDALLGEVATRAEPEDTVALDYTARVNQHILPRPIRAPLIDADPAHLRLHPGSIVTLINQVGSSVRGRLYILISHDHERFQKEIERVVAEAGIGKEQFRLAWTGRTVGLYVYTARP